MTMSSYKDMGATDARLIVTDAGGGDAHFQIQNFDGGMSEEVILVKGQILTLILQLMFVGRRHS